MFNDDVAKHVEYTVDGARDTRADVDRAIDLAISHRIAALCVTPVYASYAARRLNGIGVKTCALIGHPNGTHKPVLKAIEATSCIKDGADEVEIVAFQPHFLAGDLDAARQELLEIARAARAVRSDVVIKVRYDFNADLSDPDLNSRAEVACRAVRESAGDYVVIANDERFVAAVKGHAGGLLIKCVGPTIDANVAKASIAIGVDRLQLPHL